MCVCVWGGGIGVGGDKPFSKWLRVGGGAGPCCLLLCSYAYDPIYSINPYLHYSNPHRRTIPYPTLTSIAQYILLYPTLLYLPYGIISHWPYIHVRNYLINSTYSTHYKQRIPHEIYAQIGDEISRQNSAISVTAVLHFTWCGAVHTFSHTCFPRHVKD